MSKKEDKRKAIFEKYRRNLNLLIDNGFITAQKDVYLCPICLRPHKDIYETDPLTLEDAPPKSLGGKANTLTCKSCNSKAGHQIDNHLIERLREIDSANFLPSTETLVKLKFNGDTLQGRVSVAADGTITMYHATKTNNPQKLDAAMKQLTGGMAVDIDFLKSRVIPEKLEYALLKTGYIMMFERFGYSLILDKCFDLVRQQLRNPEQRIYPEGFWFSPPYPKTMTGVYFICDSGLESLLALFNVDTGNTERMFGTILSLPIHNPETVINKLNAKLNSEGQFPLTLYPLEQHNMKYLDDIDNLRAMYEWIEKRRSQARVD